MTHPLVINIPLNKHIQKQNFNFYFFVTNFKILRNDVIMTGRRPTIIGLPEIQIIGQNTIRRFSEKISYGPCILKLPKEVQPSFGDG